MALFAEDPFTQADQVTPTGELDCAWSRLSAFGDPIELARDRNDRDGLSGPCHKKDVYLYM